MAEQFLSQEEIDALLEVAGNDDANVLALGARVIGPEPAYECSLAFLAATFSGEPRHRRRLDKVLAIEAAEAAPD